MIVKFIVAERKIHFGTKDFRSEEHADIAGKHGFTRSSIAGGGLADMEEKRIYGKSVMFGGYDREMVQELLPDWRVDPPAKS